MYGVDHLVTTTLEQAPKLTGGRIIIFLLERRRLSMNFWTKRTKRLGLTWYYHSSLLEICHFFIAKLVIQVDVYGIGGKTVDQAGGIQFWCGVCRGTFRCRSGKDPRLSPVKRIRTDFHWGETSHDSKLWGRLSSKNPERGIAVWHAIFDKRLET